MNNLTSETHGLRNLPESARISETLHQRVGEAGQFQQSGAPSLDPVVRIESLQTSRSVASQFVITVLIHSAALSQPTIGLADSLKGRGGISAYLPPSAVVVQPIVRRPLLYRKNGILVGHTGRAITPENVANALAKE